MFKVVQGNTRTRGEQKHVGAVVALDVIGLVKGYSNWTASICFPTFFLPQLNVKCAESDGRGGGGGGGGGRRRVVGIGGSI